MSTFTELICYRIGLHYKYLAYYIWSKYIQNIFVNSKFKSKVKIKKYIFRRANGQLLVWKVKALNFIEFLQQGKEFKYEHYGL
jgi:hypothetical protein